MACPAASKVEDCIFWRVILRGASTTRMEINVSVERQCTACCESVAFGLHEKARLLMCEQSNLWTHAKISGVLCFQSVLVVGAFVRHDFNRH